MALLPKPYRRRVTRQQTKFFKTIFPFLALPAEIRELIYFFCFSFANINGFFSEFFNFVKAEADVGNDKPLGKIPFCSTPSILLISRQIFCEAITLIRKHSITFNHGIFNIKPLSQVITPNPLRQLSSIEITDKGHPLLTKKTLSVTWHGYMRLIKSLAQILSKGHHLKNFTIRFDDPNLVEHVTTCAAGSWNCGFRDQLRDAILSLKIVRGVKNVTFIGLEKAVAEEVKHYMQRPKVIGFEDFPDKVREIVYGDAFDWSSVSNALARSVAKWPNENRVNRPFPNPKMTTPTILLLNKRITKEALAIIRSQPLNIVFPTSPAIDGGNWRFPQPSRYLPIKTLRHVTTLNITLKHWKWAYNLILPLSAVLREAKKLQKFTITVVDVDDKEKQGVLKWPRSKGSIPLPYHPAFHGTVKARELKDWGVSGHIGEMFVKPLGHVLMFNEYEKRDDFGLMPTAGSLYGRLVWGR
ncbi:hypothetical protein M409DRAFT_59305 [Zasmidium cellare ATCC 36951]|uniref:Uncharacterized protein n=1 Tax=Zasmidium cellare ATCC 36951 TaxID=1080233 RepID=A0A6A6C545_ZASCE|nr:uncharacterized protein M409DRAFT_59305 [Zasmidium cellare ATCC 36951]KAF2161310.1 hypothetical protein M409DRAFT_59305 [Zasmidium cellare ATCC 36951]